MKSRSFNQQLLNFSRGRKENVSVLPTLVRFLNLACLLLARSEKALAWQIMAQMAITQLSAPSLSMITTKAVESSETKVFPTFQKDFDLCVIQIPVVWVLYGMLQTLWVTVDLVSRDSLQGYLIFGYDWLHISRLVSFYGNATITLVWTFNKLRDDFTHTKSRN